MNDLQRVDLQDQTTKVWHATARPRKQVALYLLAALIVSVMIAWFAFLGWGMIELLQWLSACIKSFWTNYF